MNYKFKPNDKVKIVSYVGIEIPCVVYSVYTSDTENHTAQPHNRYVCQEESSLSGWSDVHDVSESELVKQ